VRVPIKHLLAMGSAIVFFVALGAARLVSPDGAPDWADANPLLLALAGQ